MLQNDVQPGELVAFYLQNSPEFMFGLLGSWAIGSAPAMINYNLGGDSLIHCLKLSGSKIVLVDEDSDCRSRIEEERSRVEGELGMKIIILDAVQRDQISAIKATRPDDSYRATMEGEFPMCLIYTSGTTGMPKACPFQVQRSHSLGHARVGSLGLKAHPNGDRWYDCMPLYHGTGCTVAVTCMMAGLTLCIGKKFSTRNFWSDVRDSKSTAFVYVGETARYLLTAPPSPLDKQHHVKLMFGNGLRPDVWKRFQERFGIDTVAEFFNSTEGVFGLLNISRGPFHEAHVGHHGGLLRWMFRDQYIPVQIDHETGGIWRDPETGFAKRKSYDEGGEIIAQCPSEAVFCGYWNNPQKTAEKFERDVFRKGDLYYRTGDALRRDDDGRWYFLDRLGDTFRWKSENVSTAEVGLHLGHFPGIVEANVYGVEVPSHDGRAGCAAIYIRPEERASFDFAGLLAHARKSLPKYAVPVFLRIIGDMAPMHNNKQNKVPLRKEGVDPEKIAAGTAGRDDKIVWTRPGIDTYEPFGASEWQSLVAGKARL